MKQLFPFIAITIFFTACGGGEATQNKQAELDKLIKQQTELNEKIRTLRAELIDESGISTARLVSIESVMPAEFNHFVEVQAKVDGEDAVSIGPRLQGTVEEIKVREGVSVRKGQVMATLDDQLVRQNLAEVKTQYDFAKTVYEKRKALWEQQIGTELEYLSAMNNYNTLEKRLAGAREQFEMTRIKSPIDGVVDYVDLKVGQAVMPGIPVIRVVNLSNLTVKGEVAESFSASIMEGDDVILYFPDLKTEITSSVKYAAKVIDPLNRTFLVEVPLNDTLGLFKPNMVVVMKISDYKNMNALTLPVDLVQSARDGNFVMVAKQQGINSMVAERKVVTTGMSYNGKIEVTSGIESNDKVIMNGYRDLNEGTELRIK